MRILFKVIPLLLLLTSVDSVSLKNLSKKLSTAINDGMNNDNTKEKVPNIDFMMENINNNSPQNEVSELDHLKSHKDKSSSNADKKLLESSLKKLHRNSSKLFERINDEINNEIDDFPMKNYHQKEVFENIPMAEEMEELTTTANLITLNHKSEPLNPYTMLRQLNGKYSAYDMAQYIFWTGDEEGVSKSVEELINEGLMSRENAIQFLNDIRLGIDYLENMYSLKSTDTKNTPSATTARTTTTQDSNVDDIPFYYNYNYQKFHSFFKPNTLKEKINFEEEEAPTLSPVALKALERIPSLAKLTEIHHDGKHTSIRQHNSMESEENLGRSRLVDFLFGEYSLEEVIYQLAKVMFTQSLLSHESSSGESQAALQKLTHFLENEGKHGRISPSLQKKILDVLLAALSDTLNDNPEIMKKAHLSITN